MRAVGVAAQWLPKCCPDAATRPLQLVESYDTSSPMPIEALRRHDAASRRSQGRWMLPGRERRCRLAKLGEGFWKQQSPSQHKGGEAPGGLEGAVAELFFRPENAPLRGEACCPVPRRALGRRVGANRSLQRLCCARCGTARAALVTISDCCKGLPLVKLFLSERPAPPQNQHRPRCGLRQCKVDAAATHSSWHVNRTEAAATPRRRAAGP